MLIGFICEEHGYINVEQHGQRICPHCQNKSNAKRSEKYSHIQINAGIKPFFCDAVGREVTSREERDKIAKDNGWVFGDDKDFETEATNNKKYNEEKIKKQFRDGLKEELGQAL